VSALLRAEVLKLGTTRALYGYLFVLVLLTGIAAAAQASEAHVFELDDPPFQRNLLSDAVAAPLIALLLGIVSVTIEWRHGTITRTLLVSPHRSRVLLAKEVNASLVGVALAVLGVAVALAVAIPVLSGDGTSFVVDGALLARIAEIVLATALWGALGAGVGALVQNQTAALVGAIIFIIVLESLLEALLDWVNLGWLGDALPRHALDALGGHESGLLPAAGGAIGVGYVVLFAALAWLRVRRQDIT
jgi:ABC-type transport system involved in multi-copper enzyme maturation permease subunit